MTLGRAAKVQKALFGALGVLLRRFVLPVETLRRSAFFRGRRTLVRQIGIDRYFELSCYVGCKKSYAGG